MSQQKKINYAHICNRKIWLQNLVNVVLAKKLFPQNSQILVTLIFELILRLFNADATAFINHLPGEFFTRFLNEKSYKCVRNSEKQKHKPKDMDKINPHNLLTTSNLIVDSCHSYVVVIIGYFPIQSDLNIDYQPLASKQTLEKYKNHKNATD